MENQFFENVENRPELPPKIDAVYVLFQGNPKEKLSFDAKMRTIAGIQLIKDYPDAEIFLVGGGIDKSQEETGSGQMARYAKDNLKHNGKIGILEKSNNTAFNIRDIIENEEKFKEKRNIIIISNEYHIKRIKNLCDQAKLESKIISAENIFQEKSPRHKKLAEKYKKSSEYEIKKISEGLLSLYLKIDPQAKIIEKIVDLRRKL